MDNQDELAKISTNFKIKGLKVYKLNKHPCSDEAFKKADQIIKDALKEQVDCEYDETITDFAALTFVYAQDVDTLTFLMIMCVFGFMLDDKIDENPQDLTKIISDFNDRNISGDTKLDKLAQLYFTKGKDLVNQRFYDAIHKSFLGWIEDTCKIQANKNFYKGVADESFIEKFLNDHASPFQFDLLRVCIDLEVTDDLKKNKDWLNFYKNAATYMCIANDLFSFMKEVKGGQGKSNYVYIKMKNNKLTIEETVAKLVGEINKFEQLALQSAQRLYALEYEEKERLNRYVDSVLNCMYAIGYWSTLAKRNKTNEYQFFDTKDIID